ncbi:hypothetical protein [Caulobacter sp. NIBR2454]|uniref:hypothetical protein n=1 Tax=Caulobacter sp. NIBR2454 TaxID=3015996 RepID=UPI0022B6746F|nr:hypothetical protein [Caulobacter sp. NIBR2454]
MCFTQLNPTIPMTVEGKGKGYAVAVIDYGQEHHLIWVVVMDDTGEIWSAPNPTTRVQSNWTMGRGGPARAAPVEPLRQAASA